MAQTLRQHTLIKTDGLIAFYEDRNLISHNYYRTFMLEDKDGVRKREDGEAFLKRFIDEAQRWENVLRGLLFMLMLVAAKKEGREGEIKVTEDQVLFYKAFYNHAESYFTEKQVKNLPTNIDGKKTGSLGFYPTALDLAVANSTE